MKTKSKRFLNLATLCLALLGTTLLTTQPVKAEEGQNKQQEVSVSSQSGQSEGEDRNDFKEGFRDGYPAGYVEGWRKSHPLWAIVQDVLPWLYNFLR
ncbi:TPA: hypothetical protein ACHIFC_001187 [Streptococcus pyogenes]|nr:hypothetical protein [Streptococcus pyogenes]